MRNARTDQVQGFILPHMTYVRLQCSSPLSASGGSNLATIGGILAGLILTLHFSLLKT